MAQSKFIYLGVKGSVLALNSANGQKLWATDLKGLDFVNVVLDGNNLFAATHGEIFCLDPRTGIIRWHNPLKGYGWGLISIAGEGVNQNFPALPAEKQRQDQQAANSSTGSSSAATST
jgi:outer membrane protein assembly factor BamB